MTCRALTIGGAEVIGHGCNSKAELLAFCKKNGHTFHDDSGLTVRDILSKGINMAKRPPRSTRIKRVSEVRAEREAAPSNVVQLIPTPALLLEDHGSKAMEAETKLMLLRDHILEYPQLWLSVYIAGNRVEQQQFAELFVRARCAKARSVEEASFVVFTGGSDVNPALYGEPPHRSTGFFEDRDDTDIALFYRCLELGIPMIGVCRGAQFLAVMHGGKLFQDADGHYGEHPMWDRIEKRMLLKTSSSHHQMVRPDPDNGMEILATTNRSRERTTMDGPALSPQNTVKSMQMDVEAFFYRDTCALGVQGHPEYSGFNEYSIWFLQKIEDYFVNNTDVDWEGAVRRIKPDILGQRRPEIGKPRTVLDYIAKRLKERN